jgi:membrane-associated phospholipid phosphatase
VAVLEWLEHIDKLVFGFIQSRLTAGWLDGIMVGARNPLTWIPLYLFLFIYTLRFEKTLAFKFIGLTLVCFAFTDFSSAHLIKPLFERLRPCYDPETDGIVRGIVSCGGKYSFPSSHAANHFGLAGFWFYSIHLLTGRKWRWLWVWASLVCFAQVYVGVHFPLDVLGGALLGMFTGISLSKVFKAWSGIALVRSSGESSFNLH